MQYYLSIGSNLGNRLDFLQFAINELQNHATISKVSKVYETEALGFETDNLFLNACLQVESTILPFDLLKIIHQIEFLAGRQRFNDGKYHSRPLDIDIIFCDNLVIKTENLVIPHPKYTERKFVLLPLNDLSKNLTDPVSKIAIKSLIDDSLDHSKVEQRQLALFI
jgi:deoxyguanosine kinase